MASDSYYIYFSVLLLLLFGLMDLEVKVDDTLQKMCHVSSVLTLDVNVCGEYEVAAKMLFLNRNVFQSVLSEFLCSVL